MGRDIGRDVPDNTALTVFLMIVLGVVPRSRLSDLCHDLAVLQAEADQRGALGVIRGTSVALRHKSPDTRTPGS